MAQQTWYGIGAAGLAGLTAFILTLLLTPLVRLVAIRLGWAARPVGDRWGRRVTARSGGLAMFVAFLASTLVWVRPDPMLIRLLMGLAMVFVLGLLDDARRLPPYTKLAGQLLVGCLVVVSGLRIELIPWAWLSVPLTVLWFVFVMNAFNLLDNMDGLAAGIGALAAGFCMAHAVEAGQWSIVLMGAILCGTCVGFLRFNFPPAKIYMGDSGSHFLGLSLAALALLGSWRHSTHLLSVLAVPVFVLAVPIFDTCFVTIQRLIHGRHPFAGGTDHVSHRLAVLGLSARQTVLVLYGFSASLGLLSILSTRLSPWHVGVMWSLVVTGLLLLAGYLANVRVYRLEQTTAVSVAEPDRPVTFIETMLLHKRRLLEVLADFALLSSAYVFAWLLRFEGHLTPALQKLLMQSLPVVLTAKLACFMGCGLYGRLWRYLGLADLLAVAKAVTFGSVLSTIALLVLWRFEGYSRAVVVIDWMLCVLTVGGARMLERLLDEWIASVAERGDPTLIIGAGDTGARVLRSLREGGRGIGRVVGFLDDDRRKGGSRILNCSVLGTRAQLAELLEAHGIREVLVAISDPPGDLLEHVRQCCEPRGVAWKVVTAGVTAAT